MTEVNKGTHITMLNDRLDMAGCAADFRADALRLSSIRGHQEMWRGKLSELLPRSAHSRVERAAALQLCSLLSGPTRRGAAR